jgi:hypothetical protein
MLKYSCKFTRGYLGDRGMTHSFCRVGNSLTPLIVVGLMALTGWLGSFIILGDRQLYLGWSSGISFFGITRRTVLRDNVSAQWHALKNHPKYA